MTIINVEMHEEPRRLLHAIIDKPLSREECVEIIGHARSSAAALGLLRDLRFVRFDPEDREWFATDDGRKAAGR